MPAPILIFGIGNESRGDDALGVLMLRQLERELGDNPLVEFVETFQLQVEHALELTGRVWVLFIDAGTKTPAPVHFYQAEALADRTPFTHALSPEALLAVHRQVEGEPPSASVLCVRGEDFELGHSLSDAAASYMESALELARDQVKRHLSLLSHRDGAGITISRIKMEEIS